MCEMSNVIQGADLPVDGGRVVRRKLWDLDHGLHCSIIGTCLTLDDLRKLSRKLGIAEAGADDYDIHVRFVRMARERNPGARMMQKILERRHRRAIARFAEASDAEALGRLWAEALKEGDIPGAYWATQTHPALSPELEFKIFGDTHMLSHIAGASNRADVKDLTTLREDRAKTEEALAAEQARRYRQVAERDARIAELEAQVGALNGAWERVRDLERDMAELQSGAEAKGLRITVREVQRELTDCMAAHSAVRRELHARERDRDTLEADNRALSAALAGLEAENRALEAQLESGLGACPTRCDAPAACADLAGRCVLYVGGRPQHACRFRAVVERWNGTFLHHDGGREQSDDALEGVLTRADIVVFPTDCISHSAVRKIKDRCRGCEKPYVPVRTSGLGAFVSGLKEALDGPFPETAVLSDRNT